MKNLNYGPINKSLHTQKFELLIKCILQSPNAIHYDIHTDSNGKDALFAQIGQAQVNVSSLVQKINFNHLSFSQPDSHQYFKQNSHLSIPSSYLHTNESKYSELTTAEKCAIFKYSDLDYVSINSFLYGEVRESFQFSKANGLDSDPNKLMANIAFLASGLNKVTPSIDLDAPTFRGETYASFEEMLHRIQCINNNC